jgi:predicted phosphoribosyltransferase
MFASREDAGRKLGAYLMEAGLQADLVLGLPRGGVIVAAEVARLLHLPLDVLIVRKIGHPWHREFAVGALAEGGVALFDERSVGGDPLARAKLSSVVEEEKKRLEQYRARFHLAHLPDLRGRGVLLVDDGLATGATTEAAVLSARQQDAAQVLVAAPVASTNAVERLRRAGAEVLVLAVDPDFDAVGRYYDSFSQTTDEEVLAALHACAASRPAARC